MKCAVVGLGYVGLATAVGLATRGHDVSGIDIDANRIAVLQGGRVPVHEPGLDAAMRALPAGRLTFASAYPESLAGYDLIFLCVGTPTAETGEADLAQIAFAVRSLLRVAPVDARLHLVIRSTAPPDTGERIGDWARAEGHHVFVSCVPEFLREGHAWEDSIAPDRIVIGCDTPTEAIPLMEAFACDAPMHVVPTKAAALIKYMSNAVLATQISLANEMAAVAEGIGIKDVAGLFRILHEDRRWSGRPAAMTSYLFPGCGFGGYCLPKDLAALVAIGRDAGVPTDLLSAVEVANRDAVDRLVAKVVRRSTPDHKIAILGLAFKPGSDDVRGTPAAAVIHALLRSGRSNLVAYDPIASAAFRATHQLPVRLAKSLTEALDGADLGVVVTAWPEFGATLQGATKIPIIDGRYMSGPSGDSS